MLVYGFILTTDDLYSFLHGLLSEAELKRLGKRREELKKMAKELCENEEKSWDIYNEEYMSLSFEKRVEITEKEMWNEYKISDFPIEFDSCLRERKLVQFQFEEGNIVGFEDDENEEGKEERVNEKIGGLRALLGVGEEEHVLVIPV